MFRKYRWILYSAVLLLISSAAFAASSPTAPTISADAVTNQTDLSVNFLGQIFGTVGNVLVGSSGQMLGQLFYEFNVGILVVASLWLSYSVLTLVMGSASEGSFMGKQNNIAYTFLRIAIGMGALIPSPTTGYCVIQDIVMEVVVQGVALADMTWTNGMNYIQTGGAVWRPPVTSGDNGANALQLSTAQTIYSGKGNSGSTINTSNNIISQVFMDEVCMDIGSITGGTGTTPPAGNMPPMLNPNDNQNNFSFDFPSSNASSDATKCGSINWGNISNVTTLINDAITVTPQGQYAYQAVYQVVYGMLPVAKEYACSSANIPGAGNTPFCTGVNTGTLTADMAEAGFTNLLGYVNAITPLVVTGSNQAANNLTNFFDSVNSQGWIMAGRYSWDIAHLQDQYMNAADYANYLPAVSSPTASFFPAQVSGINSQLNTAWNGNNQANSVVSLFNNYSGGSQAGNGGSAGGSYNVGSAGSIIFSLVGGTAGGLIADIVNLEEQFSSSNIGDDPLYFLHRVGIMCMGVAGEIWINLALIVGGLYLIGIFCSGGALDLDKPIQGVVDWIKPIMMAVAGIFIVTGGMLAFYVPLYAFLLFTFAVIGWFIAVIEAVACAPMIAFGLTHPEGHDLLGSAKQALILLLGVFLRPTLIVIGLIGGMILSFVAFRMVNYGFSQFMGDIFSGINTNGSATNSSVLGGMNSFLDNMGSMEGGLGGIAGLIIGMPVMMIMYTGIVFLVANQAYSLISVLPDYILRWIGSSPQQSNIGQLVEGLKSGVSQTSQSMGEGTSGTMIGTGRGAASAKAGSDKMKENKGGSANIGGGDGGGAGGGLGGGGAGAA